MLSVGDEYVEARGHDQKSFGTTPLKYSINVTYINIHSLNYFNIFNSVM
jgi:hypothetical protein